MFTTTLKKGLFKPCSVIFQVNEVEPKMRGYQSHGDDKVKSPQKWIFWRQLSPKSWQLSPCETSPPPVYFFHGNKLGPRPLIVLDEVVSPNMSLFSAKGQETSTSNISVGILPLLKYEGILTQLNLEHGAISLPLYYNAATENDTIEAYLSNSSKCEEKSVPYKDFITRQCESVIKLMDTYHIQWANILCRSTGALLAAKLALLYPERVGGLISLDTPLVSKQWQSNTRVRREILKAIHDVNVPSEELIFAVRGLIGVDGDDATSLEPAVPVPCPSKPIGVGSKLPFYSYQRYMEETSDSATTREGTVSIAGTYTFDNNVVIELLKSVAKLNQSCYEDTIFHKDLVYPGIIGITTEASYHTSNSVYDTPFSSKALMDHPLFSSMIDDKASLTSNLAVGFLRIDGLLTSTKICTDISDNTIDASSAAMIHSASVNPTVTDTIISLLPHRVRYRQIDRQHEKSESDNVDVITSSGVCRGVHYSLQGSGYLSIDQMRYIQHPLMLIVPPDVSHRSPLSDIDAHRECFNIRKATVVKSAGVVVATTPIAVSSKKKKKSDKKENEDMNLNDVPQLSDTSNTKNDESDTLPLFENAAVVKEVAQHCKSFLNRFDFDVVIRRRMEQVARETMKKLEGAKSVGVRSFGEDDSGKKKKKKGTGTKS